MTEQRSKGSSFFKFLLFLMGVACSIGCIVIGQMTEKTVSDHVITTRGDYDLVAGSITSGFNGGAIGLGIIAAACFVCFTWLQVIETKKT